MHNCSAHLLYQDKEKNIYLKQPLHETGNKHFPFLFSSAALIHCFDFLELNPFLSLFLSPGDFLKRRPAVDFPLQMRKRGLIFWRQGEK